MRKRIASLLLAIMLIVVLLPVNGFAAAASYDSAKAVKYADEHWDDGVGLCAAYVARCMKAGGIDVMESGFGVVATLYKRVKAKAYVTQYKLTYNGNYKNSSKVQPGDPIFYYCETCKKALHVVICRRIDADGRIRYNAHNNAAYDKKLYSATASHCAHYSSHKYSIYVLHINKQVKVTSVKLALAEDITICAGETAVLTAAVTPSNATDKGIRWTSSAAEVASVDETGTVIGHKPGEAVITAKAKDGSGQYDSVKVTVKALQPNAVTSVTAANSAKGVRVTWTLEESVTAGADGFYIYRRLPGKSWTRIADLNNAAVRAYTDGKAQSGVNYIYTVRAYAGADKTLGAYPKAGATVLYLVQPKLSQVSNVKNGVTVKWVPVNGAENYRIYRKTPGGSWKRLKTVSKNTLSYTDTSAQSGSNYMYTVRALSGSSLSSYDGKSGSIQHLAMPQLSSVRKAENGITVIWVKVEGAEKYRVYRKLSGGSWKWLKTVGKNSLNYTDATAEQNKSYIYTVRALSGNCLSSYDGKSGAIINLP